MGNRFFESIRQVSIFLIGTQMILHLKPAKEYEKYIKFLVNLMALSIVLVPLLKLFCGNGEAAFDEKLAAYEKELTRVQMMLQYEREYAGYGVICGIDEAGRGPLAGPVVAAAVILDVNNPVSVRCQLIIMGYHNQCLMMLVYDIPH